MSETNGELRKENGQFAKGNPGKPKGAVVKVSVKVRESIINFLENNVDKIQADFDKLGPRARLQFVAEILPYAAPKLSSIQHEGEVHAGITIRFDDARDYVYPTEDQSNTGIPESV